LVNGGTKNKSIMRLFLISTLLLSATSFCFSQNNWQKQKEDEGIIIYTQEIPNSNFKAFKGEGEIDASLTNIVAVFLDMKSFIDWSPGAIEAKTLQKVAPNERINYIVTDAPWPVTDRDGVYQFSITQNPTDQSVLVQVTAKEGHYPIQKKRIRITQSTGYWKLIPISKNKTKVIYENHADPAGSLPAWLVNSSTVSLPFNTIKNLRKQAKKEQYQNRQFTFVKDFI
jgi:hypothetical protein